MKNKGFTLIELLVVISVIAVLMSMLVPCLGMARKKCQAVSCQSNLRQFVFAAQTYAANNNDFYPPSRIRTTADEGKDIFWDFIHFETSSSSSNAQGAGGTPQAVITEPGLLWLGDTIQKVQQCPVYKGLSNTPYDPFTGYNYNTSYIGHYNPDRRIYTSKVTQVRRADNCIIFGDGEFYSGANKFMRSPFKSPKDGFSFREGGTQGFRHNEKTNIAWCDGHVSSQKEYYTETLPKGQKKIEKHNKTAQVKTGFISADNSAYDLK